MLSHEQFLGTGVPVEGVCAAVPLRLPVDLSSGVTQEG